MASVGTSKPLTEIEEIKELIDSNEQQLAISILEDKKHIRKQKNFNTLIEAAVIKEREQILNWFVRNVYDKNKNAALEMAVNSGIENVINLALENGADVNEGLYFAVKANKLYVIKLLLAQDANINYNRNGYTLLHTAVMQNCELFIVEFLIHKVKDIHAVAKNKKTAFEMVQVKLKMKNDDATKKYLENVQNIILLAKPKATTFDCLQGLPDNLRGYIYQIKLFTLYAIVYTKLAISTDCEYELGTEAADQVPFDDIYIKEKSKGQTNCQFVQVKQIKSPQYKKLKESKFFTILKTGKEINIKEDLKGNDTIVKMFMAFDKISKNYLQNVTSGDFVYATNMNLDNNSCIIFIPSTKDDLLCGIGGNKWQISETYFVELEIKFILLNIFVHSQFITMIDMKNQLEIKEQIQMINNMNLNERVSQGVNKKLWPVFKIAKEGSDAIEKYLNELNESRKNVRTANDEITLKSHFPDELELPQNEGNFEVFKTSCISKINEIYKSLKSDKALYIYFSKWEDAGVFTDRLDNFVQHFCIYTDCPNIEILDDIITKEICEEFMINKLDILSSYCVHRFSNWILNFKNDHGNLFTESDGKKLFSDLTEQILMGFGKIYDEDLQGYDVSFKNINTELLNLLSYENSNKIVHVVTDHPRLHTINILQTLKTFEGQSIDFSCTKKVVVTNSEIIFKSDDTLKKVIKTFAAKVGINYFILELVNDVIEFNKLFEFLNKLQPPIAQNTQSKIILIGKHDNLIALSLKSIYSPSGKYVSYNEVICFKNLTAESQKNVLERSVIFTNSANSTGINLKLLNFLTQSAACDFIDEVLLSEIITKINNIQIGNSSAFCSDEYNANYYIPRTVHRQILDKSVLAHSEMNLFFVTGICARDFITAFDVQKEFIHYWKERKTFDVGIILLPDHYNRAYSNADIFTLISKSCGQNTYWLDIRDNLIFWRGVKINNVFDRIHLKIPDINKKISTKHSYVPNELEEKVVILANDAGEGKSTMLTDLAHVLKKKFSQRWIVRVDLKFFVNQTQTVNLSNIKFTDDDTSNAIEFVTQMVIKENNTFNAILERQLFKAALNGSSQIEVILLFDGFDEISPSYKEQTCTLLKALAKSKVRQLWVTTRIHLKDYLEEQLQTPAYKLTPFSEKQVIQYLNRFWKWNLIDWKNNKMPSEMDTDENFIGGALDCLKTGCQNYIECGPYGSEDGVNISHMENVVSNYKSSSMLDFYKFIDEVIDLSPFARLASEKWSVIRGGNEFLNVPLNLEMFAENLFANKWDYTSMGNLQLFEIYKRFVDGKLEIYKRIKSTTHTGRPADKDQGEIASVVLRDMHREIAVKTLFEPSDSLPDINVCKKHEDLTEKLPRVGLMKFYGNRFEFTHRTYAEFFFIEYLSINLKMCNVQQEFLPKILMKKEFLMLRKLFNGFLSQWDVETNYGIETNFSLKNILLPSISKEIVSISDEEGNSVLHIAVIEGHTHIFEFIVNNIKLDDFISLNMKTVLPVSSSLLHLIIENFHCNLLIITMDLIGIYPETLNHLLLMCNRVGTCLHEVATLNLWSECDIILKTVKKHEALLKDVMTAKASNGYTPVEYALIYNNTKIIDVFVKTAEECINDDIISDLLPNIYFSCNITLHDAVGWSLSEIFVILQKLRRGKTFNLEKSGNDSDQMSALHLAACKGDPTICFKIMNNYFNKFQLTNCSWRVGTPLHLAAEYGHSEICKLIIKFSKINFNIFEDLIMKCDHNCNTALCIAVLNGQNEVCDVILNSVEYDYEILNGLLLKHDSNGRHLLHLAAYVGNSKICDMIIKSVQNYPSILNVLLNSKDLINFKTPLHLAADTSNSEVCDIIIRYAERHPDLDLVKCILTECDYRKRTILHMLIESGNSEGCKIILEVAERYLHLLKFLLKKCDNTEETPLQKAAQLNHNEIFDLIAMYVINNQDIFDEVIFNKNIKKFTVLHIAADKGNAEICTTIITFIGNKLEQIRDLLMDEDFYGRTALHIAAKRGHKKVCHVIINSMKMYPKDLSAVIFKFDINKQTALHVAAAGTKPIEGVKDADKEHYMYKLNYYYAAFTRIKFEKPNKDQSKDSTQRKDIEIKVAQDHASSVCKVFLETIDDINVLKCLIMQNDNYLRTVLHIATLSDSAETCKVIMTSAKELNIFNELITKCDRDENTALHLAARYGCLNACEEIIKHVEGDPDTLRNLINKCDKYKQNLINIAIINDHSDVCEIIIKCVTKHTQIFKDVIIDKGNLLHLAAEYGNCQILNSILESIECENMFKELINKYDDTSRTVLHVAASKDEIYIYELIVNFLKQYPAVIDEFFKKCDNNEQTVLHVAAVNGHAKFCDAILFSTNTFRDLFQYLLTKCDKNDQTALHLAAKGGHYDTCERILQFAKEDLDIYKDLLSKRDINKRTAFDLAVGNGFRKVCCLLKGHAMKNT